MEQSNETIAEKEYYDMKSFLFWGGNMYRDKFECDQEIWKFLELDEICDDDSIKSLYKIHNKHEDFFKSLKYKVNDWDSFRKYAAKTLMIKGYDRILNSKNIDKKSWHDIHEKYLKLSSPEFYYNYYNKQNS